MSRSQSSSILKLPKESCKSLLDIWLAAMALSLVMRSAAQLLERKWHAEKFFTRSGKGTSRFFLDFPGREAGGAVRQALEICQFA
jgi:hypothetical protein